jgi:hypothetical protein
MWQKAKIDGPDGPRKKEAPLTTRAINPIELKLGGAIVVSNYEFIRATVESLTNRQEKDFAYEFLASTLPRRPENLGFLNLCLLRCSEVCIERGDLNKAESHLREAQRLGTNVVGHLGLLERSKGNLKVAFDLLSRAVQQGQHQFSDALRDLEHAILGRSLRPEPRLIRSSRDAELVARDWLQYFGFHDAVVTPPGPDGGIDVLSRSVVAQVKMEGKPTGSPVIQALAGVAKTKQRRGAVFSLSGFTASAINFAADSEIALFRFNFQGEPEARNQYARSMSK